jgi:hypothetical protein
VSDLVAEDAARALEQHRAEHDRTPVREGDTVESYDWELADIEHAQ